MFLHLSGICDTLMVLSLWTGSLWGALSILSLVFTRPYQSGHLMHAKRDRKTTALEAGIQRLYARSLFSPNSLCASPFSAISLSTFSAVFIASTPAGTPQYVVAWMMASRISSSDRPLFRAPRT